MCKYPDRLLPVILFLLMAVSIQAQQKQVVASTNFLQDIAMQLAPENVQVHALVPLGGDPHTYEATPSDAQLAADADLILLNGLTLEGWINELIENSGTNAKRVITTRGIVPIQSMEYENAVDPHAWMDLNNGKVYARNIAEAFKELVPEKTGQISEKLTDYLSKMDSLDAWIKEQIQRIPEKQRVLITSHDAFQYYGRAYGLQLESALGTSTDAEVQTSDIVRLGEVIRESEVPAIFIESTLNPKLLQQIATDNNVSIGGELYADSLGPKDSGASTYLDMLAYDTEVIVNGLLGLAGPENKGAGHFPWSQLVVYGLIAAIMLGLFLTAYIKLS